VRVLFKHGTREVSRLLTSDTCLLPMVGDDYCFDETTYRVTCRTWKDIGSDNPLQCRFEWLVVIELAELGAWEAG